MALAAPVLVVLLLQSLYALINLAFVRELGEQAVAGLSISFQAFFLVLAVSQVVSVAALARVSQSYGAGRIEEGRAAFTTYSLVGVAVGVVAALTALLTAEGYVDLFTQDPVVRAHGLSYYRVGTLTYLLQVQMLVFGNALRATGDATTPMRLMLASLALNIALDPLLIFGLGPFPELGLAGAAWATVIGQSVAVITYVVVFARRREGRALRFARPRWRREWLVEIVTRGLPAGLQFFLISAVIGLVLRSVRPFGPTWTATAGGGFRIVQQLMLPILALAQAASAMAGQNLGARIPERVRAAASLAIRWALLYACLIGVVLFAFGHGLGRIFLAEESELPVAAIYFRWTSIMPLAAALSLVPTFVLQAAGQSVRSLAAALIRIALLAALLFGVVQELELGPEWIFGSVSLTGVIEGILCTIFLLAFLRRARAVRAPQSAAL